jgi:CRP-like cAMP-binding protein
MQYSNPYIELCFEGSSSVFKGLTQKDKEIISQHHTLGIFKKGDYLFKEGEKNRGLIFLASGKVKVFRDGVGGREQIIRMMSQLDFIGYPALFSDSNWSFSALSIENSVICTFEKNSLNSILKKNGIVAMKFLKLVSEELEFSYNRTISLSQKHVRGRLTETLLLLCNEYGFEPDGKTIGIALSREDIAHLSNMTTSNAIRTLSNLDSEGVLEIKGRKITILDKNTLGHISELG